MSRVPHRRRGPWIPAACLVAAVALFVLPGTPAATGGHARSQAALLPDRLADAEFWKLVTESSEAGGAFHSDNFTSNEPAFPDVAAELAAGPHGGAYLGVGPEQNFSYIVAIRPQISFIVDIRRQAVVQHLLFKALFELSANRADFIARLFSRPPSSGLERAPLARIWDAFPPGPGTDRVRYAKKSGKDL